MRRGHVFFRVTGSGQTGSSWFPDHASLWSVLGKHGYQCSVTTQKHDMSCSVRLCPTRFVSCPDLVPLGRVPVGLCPRQVVSRSGCVPTGSCPAWILSHRFMSHLDHVPPGSCPSLVVFLLGCVPAGLHPTRVVSCPDLVPLGLCLTQVVSRLDRVPSVCVPPQSCCSG